MTKSRAFFLHYASSHNAQIHVPMITVPLKCKLPPSREKRVSYLKKQDSYREKQDSYREKQELSHEKLHVHVQASTPKQKAI